jgi:hypothetical protein
MLRSRSILLTVIATLMAITLAACIQRVAVDDSEPDDRVVPTPEATSPPASGDDGEWWTVLATDKTFPDAEFGEIFIELAEDQETFDERWDWAGLTDDDLPDVDWDSQVVIFAGTGESGSCPLVITEIDFDDDERLITIGLERDVPRDTMCTMDWTPRVFVVALDAAELGDGELLALMYDAEFDQEIDPEQAIVIREE